MNVPGSFIRGSPVILILRVAPVVDELASSFVFWVYAQHSNEVFQCKRKYKPLSWEWRAFVLRPEIIPSMLGACDA